MISGWLLKRIDQGGGYLGANPGTTGQTWVRDVKRARIFPTRRAAELASCPENERPVELASLFERPDR